MYNDVYLLNTFFRLVTMNNALVILAIWSITYSPLSEAYVGPGMGVGVLATILGIVVGLLMLIGGIVWYPVKRLIRRFRSKK